MILYYVDPSTGFVFLQNTSIFWGALFGVAGVLLFSLKWFFKFFMKFIWLIVLLLLILILGGIFMQSFHTNKQLVILGIDAMDPMITEQLMDSGRLPNLKMLKEQGGYARLATTMPSESAVAWTSFSSGVTPGSHGIFDFVMRDPKDYSLYLSLNEADNSEGKIVVKNRKKSPDFWSILSKKRVPAYIYFCPNTFPAQSLFGKMLSGMGTPDILGTMGKFSFYTSKEIVDEDKESRGRIINVKPEKNTILTQIFGPKISTGRQQAESSVPLKIIINQDGKSIVLRFQDKEILLKQDNWSDWQEMAFKVGRFKSVYAIAKFFLKTAKPEFELYVTPIAFSPRRPPFPISFPKGLSGALTKKAGLYSTLGMPNDTWPLSEGRLDEKAFLEFTDSLLREREMILKQELKEFRGGVFFFYLDTLDTVQHMFWRYIDEKSPLYEDNSSFKGTVDYYYEKIDKVIGDVMNGIDKDAVLVVLSDHGFSSFRKAVHLNRWLQENGYLKLKKGADEGREFFEDVDWSQTKAYALGFGGIYLNLAGREYYGTVQQNEAGILKQEIVRRLQELRDPDSGEPIVHKAYTNEEIFKGACQSEAPDLFVGFNAGYRASWQSALGGTPKNLIEDNKRKWSGDHLIDSSLAPGVLFVNRKIRLKEPKITDIAPTILSMFNIINPTKVQGQVLFRDENK